MTNQIINKNFKKWAYCELVYGMTKSAFKHKRLLPIMFLYFMPLTVGPIITTTYLPIDLIISLQMGLITISVFGFIYFLDEKKELDDQYRKRNNLLDSENISKVLRNARSEEANLKLNVLSFDSKSVFKKEIKRIKIRKNNFNQFFWVLVPFVLTTPKVLFGSEILTDNVLIFMEIIKYFVLLWGVKITYFSILDKDLNVLNELRQVFKIIRERKR